MNHAALLSFACGFASLSLEILWVRLYGYSKASTPAAFGFVLCLYLLGIAAGAHFGARYCRRAGSDTTRIWRTVVRVLVMASLVSVALPAAYVAIVAGGHRHPLIDLLAVSTGAAVISFLFPIAHHLGTMQGASGRRFARVYTANVAGAAAGPLVTGYVLLDHVTLQDGFIVIALLLAATAPFLAHALRVARPAPLHAAAGATAALLAGLAIAVEPHALVRQFENHGEQPRTVVENRHGIIAIYDGPGGDDVVFGGNVYDGRTNLDPVRNTNALERPLLTAALQPAPRRVLVAGLSIGTWLALVREFPGVETIDVVEINPGYLDAARHYPAQAEAIRDPRVHVAIDDARRWLRLRPDRQYDLVIMNTTFHWRANASLLLSRELMSLMRSHMAPGAVIAFNATGSPEAFETAAHVFAHAYRYGNFVYAADFDFRARKDSAQALATFRALKLQGRPYLPPDGALARAFLAGPFVTIDAERRLARRPVEVVTDDNMITEFRYGRRLYEWNMVDLLFGE